MAYLRVVQSLSGELEGTCFELGGGGRIGRGPDNEIVLEEESVSRTHARIERTRDGWRVHDAGSSNGIRVGEQRFDTLPLTHGMQFQIGGVLLELVDPQAKPTVPLEARLPAAAPRPPENVWEMSVASEDDDAAEHRGERRGRRDRTWLLALCGGVALGAATAVAWIAGPDDWRETIARWWSPSDPPAPAGAERAEHDAGAVDPGEAVAAPATASPTYLSFARTEARYDPATGAVLEAPNGTRIEIPPGAIAEPLTVSITPARSLPESMAAALVGPAYDLHVGDREHYDFAAPIRLTLPYVRELVEEGVPVVAVWENGHWRTLESTVDAERGLVTATAPHASWFAVFTTALSPTAIAVGIGGALTAAAGWVFSETMRGATWRGYYARSTAYTTEHFAIHYYTSGAHAVPAGGEQNGVPGYVIEVGRLLEHCYATFPRTIGMLVPSTMLVRHDVYLADLGAGEYGSTPAGGPIFLHSRIDRLAQNDGLDFDATLRDTVAHELIHVIQGDTLSVVGRYRDRWWAEATAAYLAEVHWRAEGHPADTIARYYIRDAAAQLPAKPMETLQANAYYGYGAFFHALDRWRPRAGTQLVRAVDSGGDARLPAIDAAARTTTGLRLADLVAVFAEDFHHRDLASADLAPRLHQPGTRTLVIAQTQGIVATNSRFWVVAAAGRRHDYVEHTVPGLAHSTVRAVYFSTHDTLGPRGVKLVVGFPRGAPAGLEFRAARARAGTTLPAPGPFETFTPVAPREAARQRQSIVIEGFGTPGSWDWVSVLVLNPSLTDDTPRFPIARWLLYPPDNVRLETGADGTTRVSWDRVALQDQDYVFGCYEICRKRLGEPDSSFEVVARDASATTYPYTPSEDGPHEFAVRTVDEYGNQSDFSATVAEPTLEGTWEGNVQLLSGGTAAGPRSGGVVGSGIEAGLGSIEAQLRAGMPMTFVIERGARGFSMRATHVAGQPVSTRDQTRLPLRPGPGGSLRLEQSGTSPLTLELDRAGEIRNDRLSLTTTQGGRTTTYVLRFHFRRTIGP